MGNESMKIKINGSQQPFKPGEMINGEVILTTTKRLNDVTGLEIKFYGRSRYRTPDGQLASEENVNESEDLPVKVDQKKRLLPGNYRLPFQYQIPEDCKSSFVCSAFERTGYNFAARLKGTGHGYPSIILDVEIIAPAIHGVEGEGKNDAPISKEAGTTVDGYNNVEMKLQLPKAIFMPGEIVPISGVFVNKSQRQHFSIKAGICIDDGSGCKLANQASGGSEWKLNAASYHPTTVCANKSYKWTNEHFFRLPANIPTEASLFHGFRNRRKLVIALEQTENRYAKKPSPAVLQLEFPIQIGN